MDFNPAIQQSILNRKTNAAVEHLLGLVQGMMADGELNELEVRYLSTWLGANQDRLDIWPANVIAELVQATLQNGSIDAGERQKLVGTLKDLIANDFQETGSVTAEPPRLPVNTDATVTVSGQAFCFTGEFGFGTRAACTKITEKAGGFVVDDVTRRAQYLVIGNKTSPNWLHENLGRKIQKAMRLQHEGGDIQVINEEMWLQALGG